MADDRLRFDKAQVERIIARAIETEGDDTDEFSADDIARIAAELGVSPGKVSQAIAAELSNTHRTSRQSPVPGEISAARLVMGDADEIAARTRQWLTKGEGMRVRRRDGDVETWEKDPRPLANIRAGLGLSAGGKDLRGTGPVEVIHTPVPGGVNLSMRSSGSYQRGLAAGLLGGFTVLGIGGATALTIAVSQPWAWIYLFIPLVVIGAIVGLVSSRAWTAKVEGAMDRALDAIAEGPPESTDTVADVISDLRDTFGRRRQPPRESRTLDR